FFLYNNYLLNITPTFILLASTFVFFSVLSAFPDFTLFSTHLPFASTVKPSGVTVFVCKVPVPSN
ncbi:MAG: hypothetical protein IJ593_06455, partial [Lachnospiraceae bacterium]|nr:hypothetical protein [Lachnospiraceae bacterium]